MMVDQRKKQKLHLSVINCAIVVRVAKTILVNYILTHDRAPIQSKFAYLFVARKMSSRKRKDFKDVDELSDKEFDAILAEESEKNIVEDEEVEVSNSNTSM